MTQQELAEAAGISKSYQSQIESGNGRVYYIDFVARNEQGGTCTGEVQVQVPPTRDSTAIGDGPEYDSTQP